MKGSYGTKPGHKYFNEKVRSLISIWGTWIRHQLWWLPVHNHSPLFKNSTSTQEWPLVAKPLLYDSVPFFQRTNLNFQILSPGKIKRLKVAHTDCLRTRSIKADPGIIQTCCIVTWYLCEYTHELCLAVPLANILYRNTLCLYFLKMLS